MIGFVVLLLLLLLLLCYYRTYSYTSPLHLPYISLTLTLQSILLTTGFKLPLLSDLSKEMSRSFGVLNAPGTVALRATLLIDPTGTVRHSSVNDLGVGRSVEEALRVVRAVRRVDEAGGEEVCPVDWVPGQPTIKPGK